MRRCQVPSGWAPTARCPPGREEQGVRPAAFHLLSHRFPNAHVIDAEGRGKIRVLRHAKPIGHRFAVKYQEERIVPVRVLLRAHQRAIDIPAQFWYLTKLSDARKGVV